MRPTLILTRPRAQSEHFAALCQDRFGPDLDIVIAPVLDIPLRPVTTAIPADAMLIFSSANAVSAFALRNKGQGRRAYCVGDRTASAAEDAGFDAVSVAGDAEALIARLLADRPAAPLVYLHGDVVHTGIAAALRAEGLPVTAEAVYAQVMRTLSDRARAVLQGNAPVVLPVFSPRSAQTLSAQVITATAPLQIAALSHNVADAWDAPYSALAIASKPNATAMLDVLTVFLRDSLP